MGLRHVNVETINGDQQLAASRSSPQSRKESIAFSDPVDRVLYQDLLILGFLGPENEVMKGLETLYGQHMAVHQCTQVYTVASEHV